MLLGCVSMGIANTFILNTLMKFFHIWFSKPNIKFFMSIVAIGPFLGISIFSFYPFLFVTNDTE